MSAGERPARSIARSAAFSPRSTTLSSGAARRRETMPERSRIHLSEESSTSQTSSLETTRSGRYDATDRIRAPGEPVGGVILARAGACSLT
jgi:hypothetical protein